MTNGGGERLDRIEHILEDLARSQVTLQEQVARSQLQFQEQMVRGQSQFQEQAAKSQQEMAVRRQRRDAAGKRHDAEMKAICESIAVTGERIRALVRIEDLHHRRLENLEGGETA
jgi:hypothetical protein